MSSQNRFNNLDNVDISKTFKDFLLWQQERAKKNKDHSFIVPHCIEKKIDYLRDNKTDTTITWIGHATFLLQCKGLNILTDPVWSNSMGLGKRLTEPGIPINEIPNIDAVVISHNHYDHLDIKTLRNLKNKPILLVPMGLKSMLKRKGFDNVAELSWWSSYKIDSLEFVFTPAQHWSKRTLWDTNKTHWGGWIIKEQGSNTTGIYFVGDSGYFRGFEEIGQKYKVKYMLAPIGAYEPEWFMHVQHTTPEEAVRAFLDVSAEYFIPMHYDSFRLADDTPKEALDRLHNAWKESHIDVTQLKTLALGETIIDS